MIPINATFWPTVIEQTARGMQPYDLPSRMLQERIIFVIGQVEGILDILQIENSEKGRPRLVVHFSGEDEGVALISRRLSAENIAIVGFKEEERNLEAAFMRATKGLVT